MVSEIVVGHVGKEAGRVGFELFEEHAFGGDLADGLAVGRTRHGERHRTRSTMARQADHPDVVTEVLATELRADASGRRDLQDLGLHLEVAVRLTVLAAFGRERVEVAGTGQLGQLQRVLGTRTADDDAQVIRRTGGGAERADLLVHPRGEAGRIEERLRLLEQQALVGRTAALGHEQELVRVATNGFDVDLGRKVVAGVDLVPEIDCRHLRVAKVGVDVGVPHALGDRLFVVGPGDHVLALFALYERGARVLATGQDAARGDGRVFQQIESDEAVVGTRLGVVEDLAELAEVTGTQQVLNVVHRLLREERDHLGVDLEERLAVGLEGRHTLGRDQTKRRVVMPERQEFVVFKRRFSGSNHAPSLPAATAVDEATRTGGSDANNHGVDPPRPQERPDVVMVAGEDPVLVMHKQRQMRVSKVGRLVCPKQFADAPSCGVVERSDVDAGEETGKVRLAPRIAPSLGDDRTARHERNGVALQQSQHRPNGSVASVDGDQRASVEYNRHAAPRRRGPRSASAAALSSSSLKGPSSASH